MKNTAIDSAYKFKTRVHYYEKKRINRFSACHCIKLIVNN